MEVRTRFAPSPTGLLHIGGVRTALYAYLVAKKSHGQFQLRIEDTDRGRLVKESVDDIVETLNWLGLNFDKVPAFQSKRIKIYQQHTQELVKKGLAYEKDGAFWFKTKKEGKTSIIDLVGKRKIEFDNGTQDDFVILKSDGYPTYHLAHVIDDHLMEINPVIRGAEWISSIPKHVQLFQAFGWNIPAYAHLPIILGPDKSKLSKRHGAKAASEFKKDGFLPEAILNFMALLGWTPPEGQEIISLEEMIQTFDIKDVHVSNPVFDILKLEWMNGEYIRKSQNSKLKSQIWQYLMNISDGKLKGEHPNEDDIEKAVPLIKTRIKKLSDFVPLTDFLWEQPEYEREIFENLLSRHSDPELVEGKESIKLMVEKILGTMEKMEKPWDAKSFEEVFRKFGEDHGLSATQTFQLIRVAISGQTVTPPLFESIQILGVEETVARIKKALSIL